MGEAGMLSDIAPIVDSRPDFHAQGRNTEKVDPIPTSL
jgi:hypothetical protein